MTSPKLMNFWKSSKRGGGGHFQSKNLCCRFWTLNRAFSAWKWYKRVFLGYVFNQFNGNTMLNCCTTCISWEIGSYNTQQSRHTEHTHFCRNFVAKSATWFSENEGGVSKAVWNFSKNSSLLEMPPFPKYYNVSVGPSVLLFLSQDLKRGRRAYSRPMCTWDFLVVETIARDH